MGIAGLLQLLLKSSDSNESSELDVLWQFAYKGLGNIFNLPQLKDCIDLEETDVIYIIEKDECSSLHIP